MELVEALAVENRRACVVGAGGKKSTLYALASRLDRAVVTATVRIPIFDAHVARVVVTGDPAATIERAEEWPLGVVPERERDDRYRGYEPEVVAELPLDRADGILVKADGARTRLFKAPGEREPRIPATAQTVIPIASVQSVGKPLAEEYVHRPERVAALTGLDPGDEIQPGDVAAVLASPDGGLKGVPTGATVIPVINMVDDETVRSVAEEIARKILVRVAEEEHDVPRVVLARMNTGNPLVKVLE